MGKKFSFAAVVVLFAGLVAGCGSASSSAGDIAQGSAKSASNPNAVGVKVHGAWTLEVREPDGRVARTLEFHNDLTSTGAAQLADALARVTSVGYWMIELFGSPNACVVGTLAFAGPCEITEPTGEQINGHAFKNLVVSRITGGLRLKGSAIADQNGTITTVWTAMAHCAPTTAPADCTEANANGWGQVTSRTLPSVVNLQAGQQVLATVDLTFS